MTAPASTQPTDKHKWIHKLKFKKLDVMFAPDIVGNGTNNIWGPFETARSSQFYHWVIIPLCVGRFGETNEDLNKVLQRLAREAAAGLDGLSTISLLVNTDTNGGV